MRVLIVDNSKRSMQIMRRFLAKVITDVEVTEYDAQQSGTPPDGFDWSAYDALLLSNELGVAGTGVQWLELFSDADNFPASVLVIPKHDAQITAMAMKHGAHGVVSKRDLTPDNLATAIQQAVKEHRSASAAPAKPGANDAEIVAQASKGGAGYKFTRLIGQGAMSRVYLAERIDDGLTVVLKIMDGSLSEDHESVKRFIQEAQLVSELDSKFIVKIFEQGFTNRYGYMAMEFYSRGDLKQRVEHGISPKAASLNILNIARGLAVIHQVGIVHRDLKPANIMFRADDTLALADFGISKRMDQTSELTAVGAVLGTPYYMSPEQMRTEPVDHRCDLYSAGVIFYEMLMGERPFEGETLTEVVLKHINEDVPPLKDEFSIYQPVINKLMEKSPDRRHQNAIELIQDLKSIGSI